MNKKAIFLLLPFFASCFYFGLLTRGLYADPFGVLFKTFLPFYFQLLLAFLLLGLFTSLFPLFVPAIIAAPLAGLAFFLGNLTFYGTIFALGIAILTYLLIFEIQKERENYLKFSPNKLLIPAISRFLFFISIFLCIFFGFSLHEKVKKENIIIPSGFLKETVEATPPFIREYLYRYFEQELVNQVGSKIGIQDPQEVLQFLEKELIETAGEGMVRQRYGFSQNRIEQLFNQNLSLLEEEFRKKITPYFGLMPFILPIILFLMFKVAISILMFFIPGLILFFFWLLRRTGVFKIKIEQKPVEVISLE